MPPLRLSVLKTLALPSLEDDSACQDRDCLAMLASTACYSLVTCRHAPCKGNHIVVSGMDEVGTGECLSVTFHLQHHKNDRKGSLADPVVLRIPDGILLELLKIHLKWGRECFNVGRVESAPTLFVTNNGNAFGDATFVHYWTWVMGSCSMFGFQRFPPSFARTIFVTDFRSRMTDEECEAAAIVMGNSVKTWDLHYNPNRKRRLVDLALDVHKKFAQVT